MRISSPCPESWDEMPGDDRVRYCNRCSLNVYNLAIMSREEVDALVRNRQGQRLCGRLYMRGNRTATLRDCAGGRRARLVRRAVGLAMMLVIGAVSWMLRQIDTSDRAMHPPLIQKALNWIEPEPKKPFPRMMVGEICPTPLPPTPAPVPAPASDPEQTP